MKIKTTEKALKDSYSTIICVSYCGIQNLLNYKVPKYYTCGVYGWDADYYEFNSLNHGLVLIGSGYKTLANKKSKFKVSYDVYNKYNELGLNVRYKLETHDNKKQQLDDLLNRFINEVLAS